MDLLAQLNWTQWLLMLVIIGVCGFLILVILLQRGRGGGLSGAFGGAGGMSAFGAKTGDVLTWVTVAVATVFVLVAIVANFAFDQTPVVATAPAAATSPDGTTADVPITAAQSTSIPISIKPTTVQLDPATGAPLSPLLVPDEPVAPSQGQPPAIPAATETVPPKPGTPTGDKPGNEIPPPAEELKPTSPPAENGEEKPSP